MAKLLLLRMAPPVSKRMQLYIVCKCMQKHVYFCRTNNSVVNLCRCAVCIVYVHDEVVVADGCTQLVWGILVEWVMFFLFLMNFH